MSMSFLLQRRKMWFGFALIAALSLAAVLIAPRPDIVHPTIPDQFTDSEFWDFMTEFSEPNGYFRSDNLVSNENAFQYVIPDLKSRIRPGGVYLGVGPDQNFTYIAALNPKVAFIVDIRRQNMLLHLMYKALFELSDNRLQFLSKLFGRPVSPSQVDSESISAAQLFSALNNTASDSDFARRTLDNILQQLRQRHGFNLSPEDSRTIEIVYNAFVSAGPDIRYSFPNQYSWRRFPSYEDLMLETDRSGKQGVNHSYMASETSFQIIKRIESENRIIPIVGDFAGEKALRAVSRYLRDHGATVSVFYTSNVEFYLFQTEDWRKFVFTVSGLPLSNESVFIRSYFNNYNLQFVNPPGWLNSAAQSYTLVDQMMSFVDAADAGRINNYFDVIRRSQP